MLTKAQRDFGFDPSQTWMIGDTDRDVAAAIAAGLRPALVRTDGDPAYVGPDGVPVFNDLMHFARKISAIM